MRFNSVGGEMNAHAPTPEKDAPGGHVCGTGGGFPRFSSGELRRAGFAHPSAQIPKGRASHGRETKKKGTPMACLSFCVSLTKKMRLSFPHTQTFSCEPKRLEHGVRNF